MRFRLDDSGPDMARDLGSEARSGYSSTDDQNIEIRHFRNAVTVWKALPSRSGVMTNGAFTEILLGLLALLLVVAAVIDVRTFTISNRLNLCIALMAPLFWWSAQLPLWPDIGQQVIAAVLVFALLAVAFYAGMMGGGDVKLAAALALWFSVKSTLVFLVYMSIAGGLLTLIVVVLHRARKKDGKPQIPYGVAIAAGGLIILIQRFLNQFA